MESALTTSKEPEISSIASDTTCNVSNVMDATLATQEDLMVPLMNTTATTATTTTSKVHSSTEESSTSSNIVRRSRTSVNHHPSSRRTKSKSRRGGNTTNKPSMKSPRNTCSSRFCLKHNNLTRLMNIIARILVWASVLSLSLGVVWYSYELTKHGYVRA